MKRAMVGARVSSETARRLKKFLKEHPSLKKQAVVEAGILRFLNKPIIESTEHGRVVGIK